MARITKAMKQQFKRYRKAYGNLTEEECLELWDYDNNWTDSDEDAQEWLRNHMLHGEIEEKELQEQFAKKKEKAKTAITKAEIKKMSAQAKEDRAARLDILEEGLRAYVSLFGTLITKTNTELIYADPNTGLPISIKVSRHKVQKVSAKTIKRRMITAEDGTKSVMPYNDMELRALAIENIMMANPEHFKWPAFAGSQMGFVCKDVKYPWGSVKITHHKDWKNQKWISEEEAEELIEAQVK